MFAIAVVAIAAVACASVVLAVTGTPDDSSWMTW